MKVEAIKFGDDGLPADVTVTMSVVEAAQIAGLFGELSDAAMAERGWPRNNIYDALSGVFCRFWDEGIAGALTHADSHR